MKVRPIIFNADMVRAVLNGSKTQTRRIIKPQPFDRSWSRHDHQIEIASGRAENGDEIDGLLAYTKSSGGKWHALCPFGQPGDRLWVRETFSVVPRTAYAASEGVQQVICPDDSHEAAIFRAGWEHSTGGIRWRPSIHMPCWASRITLEITGVRVERLNSISEDDAAAEGVGSAIWFAAKGVPEDEWTSLGEHGAERASHINSFATLWESIYGEESWQANPWVWVIEFKRVEGE